MKQLLISALAACAISFSALGAERIPTRVWVEGDSTVRAFKCEAKSVSTQLSGVEGLHSIDRLEKANVSGAASLLVVSLDCANKTMNEHMRDALKMRQHPEIKLSLRSIQLGARNGDRIEVAVSAELTLAGQTKAIVLKGQARETEKGLTVQGLHALKMTEYGITPPSLMLGTMRVFDEVKIGFSLSLDRAGGPYSKASARSKSAGLEAAACAVSMVINPARYSSVRC
jgi:polyisoprenoid-binding protein YceI